MLWSTEEIILIKQTKKKKKQKKKSKISIKLTKNFNHSKWWLHNWMFSRLTLFRKILQINCRPQKMDAHPKTIQQIT